MSYAPVPVSKYDVAEPPARGPRPDSVRLALGLVGGVALITGGIVAVVLLLSNRGAALPNSPPPFVYVANSTASDGIIRQIDDTELSSSSSSSSSSSTGTFAFESSTDFQSSLSSSSSTGTFASDSSTDFQSSLSSSSSSSSESSSSLSSSSSSTGDAIVFTPDEVLRNAARFSSEVDPVTGKSLPEVGQFPDTPCALRPDGTSACVMSILLAFGEASTNNDDQPTSFQSANQSYHYNANGEIVPYDFTSNLYGSYGGIDPMARVIDQYISIEENQFRTVLVVNAVHEDVQQSTSEAWYPSGYKWDKFVNASSEALQKCAPGSEIVGALLTLPTRHAQDTAESRDSVFLASNVIAAMRQAAMLGNNQSSVLTHLPASFETQVLDTILYTASVTASNFTDFRPVQVAAEPLEPSLFHARLQGDLTIESTMPGPRSFWVDDNFNFFEPMFELDDPAFGRYSALNTSRSSNQRLFISSDGRFSTEFADDPYYTYAGSSTIWTVIFPSYSVGFWVKQVNDSVPVEFGTLMRTSRNADENRDPLQSTGDEFRFKLLNATAIQAGHMPRDDEATDAPRGVTYNTGGSLIVQPRAWTHLLVSFDARPDQLQMRLYVNGSRVANDTVAPWPGSGRSLFVGGVPGLPNEGASVSGISNIRIWSLPLTDDGARQAFNLDTWQLPPPPPPPPVV